MTFSIRTVIVTLQNIMLLDLTVCHVTFSIRTVIVTLQNILILDSTVCHVTFIQNCCRYFTEHVYIRRREQDSFTVYHVPFSIRTAIVTLQNMSILDDENRTVSLCVM